MSYKEDRDMAGMAVIGVLLLIPLMIIMNGYVFWVLWGWFLVGLGAPAINLAQALGVSLIARFVIMPAIQKEEKRGMWTQIGVNFFTLLIVLGMGWVIKQFI